MRTFSEHVYEKQPGSFHIPKSGDAKSIASSTPHTPTPDYLALVRSYADAMIDRGRDRYGPRHSPLFAAVLDRRKLRMFGWWGTRRLLRQTSKDWGVRPIDRMVRGANPMQDQNLYRTLYALSRLTGEERYAAEADRTLKWFFENCQSPETGLFAWGEHIGWDFRTETIIRKKAGTRHEFLRPWSLWQRSFELAPAACIQFARGLWLHQIADRERCLYSRHARYDRHEPEQGNEFPRHGGFYIATWAAAYRHTSDPEFLEPIEKMVDAFEARRHPETDALMAETRTPELYWPYSALGLAVDLWAAAESVPETLGGKMRRCATRTDEVFLKIPHEPGPDGRGYVRNAVTSTLEPGWQRSESPKRQEKRRRGISVKTREIPLYSLTWTKRYGQATHAADAMLCCLRHEQTGREGFKKLFLDTAERYHRTDPDTSVPLHPGVLADALSLMHGAYRLTGEQRHLERAEAFARVSVKLFFQGSPLPRATSRLDHYEAATRADSLSMRLLDLWTARKESSPDLDIEWNDR